MFRCVFLTIDIFGKSLEFLFFDCCKSPNKLAKRLTSTNKKQLLMFKVDLSDAIGLITVFCYPRIIFFVSNAKTQRRGDY